MKYKNAKLVLPEHLLAELQLYAQGELLYIPKQPQSHKVWGASTGTRAELAARNRNIINAFKKGAPVRQLAVEYYLAEDTIRKIVYSKK